MKKRNKCNNGNFLSSKKTFQNQKVVHGETSCSERGSSKVQSVNDIEIEEVDPVKSSHQQTESQEQTSSRESNLHPNPKVNQSVKDFEEGEDKHDIRKCTVCQEVRPVFHNSSSDNASVKLKPWKINKKGICQRCNKERTKRSKQASPQPAKFSGIHSAEVDLGPKSDPIRDNSMHFLPVPPFLQNLTTIVLALISKITVCMNVHMLRYGMLAAKGHSISIPQRMKIARKLPQLPENVGILVLKRKGTKGQTKHYTVKRSAVQSALEGLCFGSPVGGFENEVPGSKLYLGPDHIQKSLKGRFFYYCPNQYYCDVEIQNDRLDALPEKRNQYPSLQIIDMKANDNDEEDKGPAPEQFNIPPQKDDETVTYSGIAVPAEPKDAEEELRNVLRNLVGKDNVEEKVAVAEWDYSDSEPLSELKNPGFFAMNFPSIFDNGSCDITHCPLVRLDINEWIEHIYFQGDNRVTKHPFLKFFLYNLNLRKQALQQGSFLVAQQLNEPHLTIAELMEKIENEDQSIPRKIIRMGGNLVNTDPYWNLRRSELEGFTFYRRNETNDLPAYFHTNSMAELHWAPLIKLLAKYMADIGGKDENVIICELKENPQYLRKTVLENLHIVTMYFDARTKNYYNTVIKELFQCDDFFYRYEFAKSRGQIHSHGLLFSKPHATKIEECLQGDEETNNESKAKKLYDWLQTSNENEDGIYSPIFTSMHPAGGHEFINEHGEKKREPNKKGWAKPEGTQEPPDYDPLMQKNSDFSSFEDSKNFHTAVANQVCIHRCNSFCLRRKKKDSKTKHCRCHYGTQDAATKETPGKEIHPFYPLISGNTHSRNEGSRDHLRLIIITQNTVSQAHLGPL